MYRIFRNAIFVKEESFLFSLGVEEVEFRSAIETAPLLDASRSKPNRDRFFPFLSSSLFLLSYDGYGRARGVGDWSRREKEPIRALGSPSREIDRPTATGIPLTGRQQEQVWNQPPDRQRTLSDGNYVYGWYSQILLDTPISEIYTGCWPTNRHNFDIMSRDIRIRRVFEEKICENTGFDEKRLLPRRSIKLWSRNNNMRINARIFRARFRMDER